MLQFLKYFKEIYVNLKSFTFVFTENSTSKSVILSKELVQSNIPVYWDPNGLCPDTAEDKRIIENVYLRTRVCWCHVTGQYYSVLDVTMLGLKTIFL